MQSVERYSAYMKNAEKYGNKFGDMDGANNAWHDCNRAANELDDAQAEIAGLKTYAATIAAERDELAKELVQWKANHQNVVDRLRLATQRNDLPVDRIPAMERMRELQEELASLKAQSEPVGDIHLSVDDNGKRELYGNLYDNCPESGFLYTHPASSGQDVERLASYLDSQDFYEVMQQYRLSPISDQEIVVYCFELVKSELLAAIAKEGKP
jgi:hypothetical protein